MCTKVRVMSASSSTHGIAYHKSSCSGGRLVVFATGPCQLETSIEVCESPTGGRMSQYCWHHLVYNPISLRVQMLPNKYCTGKEFEHGQVGMDSDVECRLSA